MMTDEQFALYKIAVQTDIERAQIMRECALTKREQFALAAMQGLLAGFDPQGTAGPMWRKRVPALAREVADDTLRELAEPFSSSRFQGDAL